MTTHPARPQKGPIDIKATHERTMRRYPRVMKALHDAELQEATTMHDTRDIYPGDQVIRMGHSVAPAGLIQGETYIVKAFNPRTVDGLELEGVEGRWNSVNFEVVGRPK